MTPVSDVYLISPV